MSKPTKLLVVYAAVAIVLYLTGIAVWPGDPCVHTGDCPGMYSDD